MAELLLGVLIGAYGLIALCFLLSFCFPLFVVVGGSVDSPIPFPLRLLAIVLGAALWPLTLFLYGPTMRLHEHWAERHRERELRDARNRFPDLHAQSEVLRSGQAEPTAEGSYGIEGDSDLPIDPAGSKRRATEAFFGLTSGR